MKNELYRLNEKTLKYEPVHITEQSAKRSNTLAGWLLGSMVVVITVAAVALSLVTTMQREHYEELIGGIRESDAAVIDSIGDEMSIERAIAKYTLTASTESISDSAVWQLLQDIHAWYPEIIMAQYKIESTSGTSNVAVNAHNLFGMKKVSGKRKVYTTQEKHTDYHSYGVYKNWQMSVIDRVLYERFLFSFRKPTRTEYLKMLYGYAEDPDYFNKIDSLAKKYT